MNKLSAWPTTSVHMVIEQGSTLQLLWALIDEKETDKLNRWGLFELVASVRSNTMCAQRSHSQS